jgi:CelD/BcsL family acetyltransferase involved in cellulose biosynthesis
LFFQNLWDEFVTEGHGALMVAIHDDQLVGGVFFLEWKDTLYYKFNASDIALVSVRPNDLIVWKAIEAAKVNGMARLDFGLSDWDEEGLVRYKRKYASDEKTITFLRSDTPPTSTAAQTREILPRLTDLLTDEAVPDKITEQAGELLYRLFA